MTPTPHDCAELDPHLETTFMPLATTDLTTPPEHRRRRRRTVAAAAIAALAAAAFTAHGSHTNGTTHDTHAIALGSTWS